MQPTIQGNSSHPFNVFSGVTSKCKKCRRTPLKPSAMHVLLISLSIVGFSATRILAQSPATPATPAAAQPAPNALFLTISAVDKQLFDDIDTCDMKALA